MSASTRFIVQFTCHFDLHLHGTEAIFGLFPQAGLFIYNVHGPVHPTSVNKTRLSSNGHIQLSVFGKMALPPRACSVWPQAHLSGQCLRPGPEITGDGVVA